MTAGNTGTFVIAWSETEIDGLSGGPVAGLEPGASWRWSGRAVRVDRPVESCGDTNFCDTNIGGGEQALKARAALAARRLVGRALPPVRAQSGVDFDEPLLDRSFSLTDGRRQWTATLVDVAEAARPLVMFVGVLPPAGTALTVAQGPKSAGLLNRVCDVPSGVICFSRGTLLRTPSGDLPVEALAEGDRLLTRDGGEQEIAWIGRRRMSGARLYAMPDLRPVRIREGALGEGEPTGDLIVSPRHRVLMRGPSTRALFGEDEVLVAAADLINDHSILRDHSLREVEYVHLMLPRHHIVWANGVETESFHPASTDLATIEPGQRARLACILPELEADPLAYGAPARRQLTRAEAAILMHEAAGAL